MNYTYLLLQFRRFSRNKVNSLINLFGLTLGIFVFLLIFIYVRHEFSYDTFHANQDRIYRLLKVVEPSDANYMGINRQAVFPSPLEGVLKSGITGVEAVARLNNYGTLVAEADGKTFFEERFFSADHDLFEILSFDLVKGENASALSEPLTLAVSESAALRYFGTTDVLGKTLELTTFKSMGPFTIDVVFRDFTTNSSFRFNVIVRFEDCVRILQPNDLVDWNNWNYNYLVKTSPGVNPARVGETILSYFKDNRPDDYRVGQEYVLDPITSMYLAPRVNFAITPRNDINRLYVLGAIAILILTIAIVNYVNLTTARALLRAKEVGVRKVTGAVRSNLVFQFLYDSITTNLLATVAALITLKLCWPSFTEFIEKPMALNFTDDPFLLISICAFPIMLGLAGGFYPALYLSSFNPVKVLKGSFARSQEGAVFRDVLIGLQFLISGGLIISLIVIYQQLKFIEMHDPGYEREHIVSVPMLDDGVRSKKDVFQAELMKHASIVTTSMATSLPHAVGMVQGREWKSNKEKIDVSFVTVQADYNYLDLFGIELLDGRNFSPDIITDKYSYIINETAARKFGWAHPVGMQFMEENNGKNDTIRIIGLMNDIHVASYRDPIKPFRIGLRTAWVYHMIIKLKGNELPATLAYIESCYKKLATSKLPYSYHFFDDQIDRLYKSDYQLGRLVVLFSMVAVLIAALGLYSISIYTVSLRLKEIGVRKVLGAHVQHIILILSGRFVLLVTIAFVLASPLAFYLISDWLTGFVYHVDLGVFPFMVTLLFLLTVSITTISVQIIRAARLNPVNVLRNE